MNPPRNLESVFVGLWKNHRDITLLALLFGLASFWCLFLLAGRIAWTSRGNYGFLAPNLLLALIPLFLSSAVTIFSVGGWRWPLLIVWLCFFPNAPYLLTDFVHLRGVTSAPIWFDILLLGSFAITGLAAACFSAGQVQSIFRKLYGETLSRMALAPIFFMTGFGIYLGRFQRWHSIDIIRNPVGLGLDILDRFVNPLAHARTWGMTIGFGGFLLVVYGLFWLPQKLNSKLLTASV